MPQFRTGDMWSSYDEADLFLITTNATITTRGALVMGRGIAWQAKGRFPGLDAALGRQVQALCGNQGIYGLLVSPRWPAAKLGAFQVKQHYSQPASLELIRHSTAALCAWCAEHPDAQVALNFPGIGNGRLRRADVLPIVTQLPEQVTIWEYPPPGKENA
jgi:hypothetical protein